MKYISSSIIISACVVLLSSCGSDSTPPKENEVETSVNETELAVEESTVNINGVDHYIKKVGTGAPVLVLHGGPGLFHNILEPHFQSIAKKYQLIFYDQRGCGQTAFPTDTSTISVDNYVEDVEGIRNHLKLDKLTIIGHSWGGLLAMHYGSKYPGNLEKMILVAPAPANSDYTKETFGAMQDKRSSDESMELVKVMSSKEFEQRDPKVFLDAIKIGDRVNFDDVNNVDKLYENVEFTTATANNLLLVNSIMEKNFFEFDILDQLSNITTPTLIIHGANDNIPFYSSQTTQEHLGNARLVVISKSGHYPFVENQKDFNKEVKDFLEAQDL